MSRIAREWDRTANNMTKSVIDTIGGSIAIIMGLLFTIFYKQLAHKTADFYYKLLHIQFGEKGYKIGVLVIGISFIIFGLLTVLHIIRV